MNLDKDNLQSHAHFLRAAGATANRARRHPLNAAGAQGSVARRPRAGTAAPERENTMKSEEQSRGQAKGFFTGKGGACFRATFYVQSFGARLWRSSMNWRAVWRSNMFLHQLAGRVRPVELVRPVQLITLAAPAGRRVNYQAASRRIHGPAGRTAARRVERRPVDGARTPRRVHGRRFPPVEEPC